MNHYRVLLIGSLQRTAFALMFLFAAIFGTPACSSGDTARSEAHKFLGELYPGVIFNVDCQDYDTNSDGYVSCTAVERTPPGAPRTTPLAIECAKRMSWNGGCRLQRAGLR